MNELKNLKLGSQFKTNYFINLYFWTSIQFVVYNE